MPTPDAPAAIGIDVGGTKIAAGLLLLPNGPVLSRHQKPTRALRGGEAVIEDVLSSIECLRTEGVQWGLRLRGVGLGVAELVDRQGRIASQATLDWRTRDLPAACAHLLPTCLDADVRCAALAEARLGAGRDCPCFLYVTIGTGISCCLVVGGQPYAGARGFTGTMASQPVTFADPSGHLTSSLALERYASGPALAARLKELQPDFGGQATEVFASAAAGDEAAREIIETAGRALGAALGHLVNVLDPERIILGGGVGLAEGAYRQALQDSLREHVWSPLLRDVPVVAANTGPDAGWIGAALIAGEHFP